jgi:hypothetical protein
MATIVWNDVTSLPGANVEMTNIPVGGQTIILDVVNSILDVSKFDGEDGPITKAARCYLAAHFAALGKLGTSGPLTGESDGRMSRQYAALPGRSELMTTSYGRAYTSLIGSQAFGPRLL